MKKTAAEYEGKALTALESPRGVPKTQDALVYATLAIAAQLDKIEDKLDTINRKVGPQ